jgi:hypothetical protein
VKRIEKANENRDERNNHNPESKNSKKRRNIVKSRLNKITDFSTASSWKKAAVWAAVSTIVSVVSQLVRTWI